VSRQTLDIEHADSLLEYLRRTERVGESEQPRVEVLRGGVSNRTVLVERATGEGWVLKQALAKLRVEVDWFSSPERIQREALGLRWMGRLLSPGSTPALIFEDADQHLCAMEAVPRPHANWKSLLLAGDLRTDHIRKFGAMLGAIHREALKYSEDLRRAFEDRSYFESLRLEPYYTYTAEQVPEAAPFLLKLTEETRATRLTLTHGDYSPKNILICGERMVLLDHEVIHFGDPAFDVGFSLTHLLSKAHHLAGRRLDFAKAAEEYWWAYRQALGEIEWACALEPRAVRHTLGCLMARVAGRSKLEYLDGSERARQAKVVAQMMHSTPVTVSSLVAEFVAHLAL